ncbi:MAG: MerR family transcriptional regulator [Chloroflexota bacterium]
MTDEQDERIEGRYTIGVAAGIVHVHQQTLRHYERLGLVEPDRGRGEIRYYSSFDIERVMQIRRLVNELGVNLAGVEVILNMRDQIEELRAEAEEGLAAMRAESEVELRRLKDIIQRLQQAQDEQLAGRR